MNTPERLNIRLTATPPDWANANVLALRQLPYLNIVETDEAPIDVVLHFGTYSEVIRQQYGTGRLGFWFFRFAGQDIDVATAARSAAAAGVALEVSLWAKLSDNTSVCLYQSFGQLDNFAPWRGIPRALAKAACFPERALARYQRTGDTSPCTPEAIATLPSPIASYFAQATAILDKIVKKLLYKEQWFVVAGKGNELLPDPSTGKWLLNPPSDSFWADPFPIERDGRVWILLEVLPFATWRGYLVAVELFADGSHGEAQTILSIDSHLSYPFIFNYQDELYMLPEAGASRDVTLWKCEQFPDRWTKAATLLTNVCFSDATLIEHNGLWWLFLTIGEYDDGIGIHDELHLYYADTPLGAWTAHSDNPVKSDARNARPAGNIFYRDGVLYRPAQDCGTAYGKATVLNRIDRLDKEGFSETPVGRIDANWRKGCLCTHTLSRSENYWAVDGLHLLPRWVKSK
jgi:hypothetical protein